MAGPDLTAVGAAFGRTAHVRLDDPPHVLDLNARYFAARRDGLESPSGEYLIVATRAG